MTSETVHSRAKREGWPARLVGNRTDYRPPQGLARFDDLGSPLPSLLYQPTRLRELKRAAVCLGFALELQRNPARGIERALAVTVRNFQRLLRFSPRALRRWVSAVEQRGLRGLEEQKLGRVGRKAVRLHKILR